MKQNEFQINISRTKGTHHIKIEGESDDILAALIATLCDLTKKMEISATTIINSYLYGMAKIDEVEAEDDR